jgi:3-methylcrotonyl-CoA carboxylase beta subunit
VDYVVDSEIEAFQLAREIISDWHLTPRPAAPRVGAEPRYPADELCGLIPRNPRKCLPMLDILARIVDDSRFDPFKPAYGETLLCGFAEICGEPVGIVANNGIMFGESAQKGAHFVQLCDRRAIPLLFVHDIVGFMVGKAYERAGIAKDGAKMVNAVACCAVPKISLIAGASHGAGNYAMAGRAYDPRFLWSWPNSRVSVMGGEQAASVLTTIQRDAARARGEEPDEAALARLEEETLASYAAESSAVFGSARLWDDGIIDPAKTRLTLGLALRVTRDPSPPRTDTRFGIYRM